MSSALADNVARLMLGLGGAYAALGLVFAVAFATRGVDRMDPAAHGARWGFRLLLVPGATLLWPFLLRRWATGANGPPRERTAHDRASAPSAAEGA